MQELWQLAAFWLYLLEALLGKSMLYGGKTAQLGRYRMWECPGPPPLNLRRYWPCLQQYDMMMARFRSDSGETHHKTHYCSLNHCAQNFAWAVLQKDIENVRHGACSARNCHLNLKCVCAGISKKFLDGKMQNFMSRYLERKYRGECSSPLVF